MKQLREKIKTIIFNERGLPGLNQKEYMAAMRQILAKALTKEEKQKLVDREIFMDVLIRELSEELAEEYL